MCPSCLLLDDGAINPRLCSVAESRDRFVPETPKAQLSAASGVRSDEETEETMKPTWTCLSVSI
jgi:hypothetical protein